MPRKNARPKAAKIRAEQKAAMERKKKGPVKVYRRDTRLDDARMTAIMAAVLGPDLADEGR